MKKVIFSAITMFAFVGSGMASDTAEKDIIIADFNQNSIYLTLEKVNMEILDYNCDLVKFRIYNIAIDQGYTPEQATSYSYKAYFNCVSKNLIKDVN